jgi:hypothetical protein
MRSWLCALLLATPLAAQTPSPEVPSPEQVRATVGRLETAYKTKRSAEVVAAIEAARPVLDPAVIKCIARSLDPAEPTSCAAALDALGRMEHPDALDALTGAWKRDKELRKHDELGGLVLKAIARHRDPRTIGLLAEDPFETKNHAAIQARILGLANIRDKASVEKLFAMLKLVGQRQVDSYMPEFRLALCVLTGHDEGRSAQLWLDWWNRHEKDFTVPKELPELSRADRARWGEYWGLGEREKPERGEQKRKGERQDDPPKRD